jgi:hypothetical protein
MTNDRYSILSDSYPFEFIIAILFEFIITILFEFIIIIRDRFNFRTVVILYKGKKLSFIRLVESIYLKPIQIAS